jgi:hypothetical protein
MDGPHLSPPRGVVRRLIATAVALLALSGGAGTAFADDAPVVSPATRWPATGTAIRTATGLGIERWGFAPCRGRVVVAWAPLSAGINGESSWTNELDPYLQPSRNEDCAITLSTRVEWDWPKLCSVVVHELGHLAGHDHVDGPDDVMFFTYVQPLPECARTAEPADAPASVPAAAATAPATPRQRPKAKTKATVKAKARKPSARRPAATQHRAKHPHSRH